MLQENIVKEALCMNKKQSQANAGKLENSTSLMPKEQPDRGVCY